VQSTKELPLTKVVYFFEYLLPHKISGLCTYTVTVALAAQPVTPSEVLKASMFVLLMVEHLKYKIGLASVVVMFMRIRQLVPKLTKVEQTVEINIIDGLFNF
jgi:hypothetical protein